MKLSIDKKGVTNILKAYYAQKSGTEIKVRYLPMENTDGSYGSPITLIEITETIKIAGTNQKNTFYVSDDVLTDAINEQLEDGQEVVELHRKTNIKPKTVGFGMYERLEQHASFEGIDVTVEEKTKKHSLGL